MTYKLGDAVTIRSDLKLDVRYKIEDGIESGTKCNKEMLAYAGKKAYIFEITKTKRYKLEIDGEKLGHYWTMEMFAGKSEEDYWEEISQSHLTDEEVLLYEKHLNWKEICEKQHLTHETWVKVSDKTYTYKLVKNPHVEAKTYNYFKGYILEEEWEELAVNRTVDDEFLLEIDSEFPSGVFRRNNPSAKTISKKVWGKILTRNWDHFGKIKDKKRTRENFIEKQALPLIALTEYSPKFGVYDWALISTHQALNVVFVKDHLEHINFELLKLNPCHEISNEELNTLEEKQKTIDFV